MQDVMVMGLASMAPVSNRPMAAMFATVMMGGMVQSAICQVGLVNSRPNFVFSMTSTQADPFYGHAHNFAPSIYAFCVRHLIKVLLAVVPRTSLELDELFTYRM